MNAPLDWTPVLSALPHLEKQSVVVVGDIMLDRTSTGTIARISPEAPVPILKVQHQESTPGGAANVALNLRALGANVTLFGVIGADEAGQTLQQALGACGIPVDGLLITDQQPTIVKHRLVAQRQQMLRLDTEETFSLSDKQEQALLAAVCDALTRAQALILSDYAKGTLSPGLCQALATAARQRGVVSIVDPKGRDWQRYRSHGYITPNRAEFLEAYGVDIADITALRSQVCPLVAELGLHALVVTCGDQGVTLVHPDDVRTIAPHPVEVFDVVGAGDTFIATFALAQACGLDTTTSACLANVAGSIVVGKAGTATVNPEELQQRVSLLANHTDRFESRTSKVMDLGTARDFAATARARNERIVFTNGCFDILHPGHLKLLTASRQAGDRLIVGLNSDASVKRLKGQQRPLVSETDRATLLAAFDFVDAVIIFEEDTPLRLIETLLPDVLVKGGDYTKATIVGADLVEARGGQVLVIDLLEGRSTTSVVERMRASPAR